MKRYRSLFQEFIVAGKDFPDTPEGHEEARKYALSSFYDKDVVSKYNWNYLNPKDQDRVGSYTRLKQNESLKENNSRVLKLTFDPSGPVFYHKDLKTFTLEASNLNISSPPESIELTSPKTGVIKKFNYDGRDQDNEGEVRGWKYTTYSKDFSFLLIND
jgi:hypothetical protein